MRVMRSVLWVLCFCVALSAASGTSLAAVTYQYDDLGRLVRVEFSSGSTIVYEYDPAGNRTQRVVTVVNQPPVAVDDTISVTAGAAHDFDPRTNDNDPEGGNLTINAKTDGAKGAVTIIDNGIRLRYTANPGASGSDSFTYTIEDPLGASDTATVNVTIGAGGFTQTIQITQTGPVNLRALADAAGYNGAQDATITFEIGSGITITGAPGAPHGGTAIDTGLWSSGSYNIALTLIVKDGGKVYGGGGAGGDGADSMVAGEDGGEGGDAVYCRLNLNVFVEAGGEIKSGGGGGAGGRGNVSISFPYSMELAGGGGGGGFPNGPGGAGGQAPDGNGEPGQLGTGSGGGTGGQGGNQVSALDGGDGGNPGQPGEGSGAVVEPYGDLTAEGGASGYAIRKNGHTVNITNNGTIVGTQG